MTPPELLTPLTRVPARFEPAVEARFRARGTAALIAVNLNTFWSIALILLLFGLWDAYVDPAHWRSAFAVRATGAAVVVATGLFQKLPGQASWMPLLAKVRLVIAVVTSAIAATMLEGGYGFGVAGVIVIILTGPYVGVDGRDLAMTNLAMIAALVPVMFAVSLTTFDIMGTAVFVLLAVAVSTLLGRVLEISNRRAFALELELHRDARTDSLTGLSNRRAMQELGPKEMKRAHRSGAPVSVIVCDLDHFKSVNDHYGHEVGDETLATVAKVLSSALRETDAIGRWGGEEFIVILAETDAPIAVEVAERMRKAIEETKFDHHPGRLTISLGVATLRAVDTPPGAWDTLLKEADQLLYRAKSEGRNRVVSQTL